MTAVTPAAEFRAPRLEGEVITLPPTGRVIRMRAVKPAELLALGDIPEPLADLVVSFLYGSLTNDEYTEFFSPKEKREQALEMINSLHLVATCAVLEPRIVEDASADPACIEVDDLDDAELRYIFDLAMLGAANLRDFRREQEVALESVADGEEPVDETLDAGERDRPVDELSD